MTYTQWSPPAPVARPGSSAGSVLGRLVAILIAPAAMLWAGACGAFAGGWFGFVAVAAITAIGIGVLIGNTHPADVRPRARALYALAVVVWGGLVIAGIAAILNSINIPSSC